MSRIDPNAEEGTSETDLLRFMFYVFF